MRYIWQQEDATAYTMWQTTPIMHDEFKGIRITPNVYTTLGELDRFCTEMERIALKGLPAQAE